MSNSQKISQMTTATVPLSGSELVPIVQSGNNVSVSVNNINATSGLSYQGLWNASTNTPTLTSSVGTRGYYYIVNVAGTTTLNGISTWNVGDWVIFSNTGVWQRIAGGVPASISITNDASSNTNYNLTLTNASSGYITNEYVDNGALTFNPSTQTLSSGRFVATETSTYGPSIEVTTISAYRYPSIGLKSEAFQITSYDTDPDNNVYNYSVFGDYGWMGLALSTTNNIYDLGNICFAVNQFGAINLGLVTGGSNTYNNAGTAGQVLASNGSSSPAYWANVGSLPSLKEMKANIASVGDVNWINGLNPVSYNKRIQDDQGNYTDAVQPEKEFGLIAEEVEAVNPEMCYYKDGKLAGVNYLQFIAPLLKKVQDLEARLAAVEGK